MYATHFEPISAREVFPSFDQPDMKGALITLNIFCHFNYPQYIQLITKFKQRAQHLFSIKHSKISNKHWTPTWLQKPKYHV